MSRRLALRLALRIDARLQRALGEGISAPRMVEDTLYARDVLLVCDAMADTELPSLAGRFRRALAAAQQQRPARAPLSIGRLLASMFGPTPPPHAIENGEPARRRIGPAVNRGTAAEHVAQALSSKGTPP